MSGAKWKLVPMEPTKDMMRAFWLAGPYPTKPWMDGYAAMLAAAPSAESAETALAITMTALTVIRDCATPDIPDADFQRRARYDLQDIARSALAKAQGAQS